MPRIEWSPVIDRAAEIVLSYNIPVTLRQLFYRLVAEVLLPNTQGAYKSLSAKTAPLRRTGDFPELWDQSRSIVEPASWAPPRKAMEALCDQYRVDRTRNQDMSLWLGVEKNALAGLLQDWFHDLGVPVVALGGYSSVDIDMKVAKRLRGDDRPAVLIYAGDFDASGMDIGRNFVDQTAGLWHRTHRIGLDETLIDRYSLPVQRGKPKDSRTPKFIEAHPRIHAEHDFGTDPQGRRYPVQVELDAVDPAELRRLYQEAIDQYWNPAAYQAVMAQEHADRRQLIQVSRTL
jgi:hypothetical protein